MLLLDGCALAASPEIQFSRTGLPTSIDLPADLCDAIASLCDRANVCRLVSLADLDDLLPSRRLSPDETRRLLAALADAGLHVIEPDAVERLAERP